MSALKKIGVIGAGQMGSGIAHVCALAGFDVLLNDVTAERIQSGLATINGNMARQVSTGKLSEADRKAALGRIAAAESFDLFADVDLVIEAAAENEKIKRDILAGLSKALKPDALLATNTSSISITRLAAATDRPEKFIGIHFMNPVPRMELVELIRGIATSDETFQTAV
ncbi:MAG TPA: 3-hydroxyacyl-CoA dehydrogenase NAD-binding domain-containing protein, partial [Rhodospirillales bacterium]